MSLFVEQKCRSAAMIGTFRFLIGSDNIIGLVINDSNLLFAFGTRLHVANYLGGIGRMVPN